jgi:hypothetical protein
MNVGLTADCISGICCDFDEFLVMCSPMGLSIALGVEHGRKLLTRGACVCRACSEVSHIISHFLD